MKNTDILNEDNTITQDIDLQTYHTDVQKRFKASAPSTVALNYSMINPIDEQAIQQNYFSFVIDWDDKDNEIKTLQDWLDIRPETTDQNAKCAIEGFYNAYEVGDSSITKTSKKFNHLADSGVNVGTYLYTEYAPYELIGSEWNGKYLYVEGTDYVPSDNALNANVPETLPLLVLKVLYCDVSSLYAPAHQLLFKSGILSFLVKIVSLTWNIKGHCNFDFACNIECPKLLFFPLKLLTLTKVNFLLG